MRRRDVLKMFLSDLLCWPVLYPQITGELVAPGALMEKWSVTQSPIA